MGSEEQRPVASTVGKTERRLAAILHADVQGYSRLIAEDEPAILRILSSHLELMNTLVRQHGGRAVGSRGDSLLAEFPSVVEAVQGAVEMQRELKIRNTEFPAERQVAFRIGINLGEIVVAGGQIHGDGINTAVRIEGLAEAGGICLSEIVYDQIKSRLALTCEDLGEQVLKNIAKPVRVYRVVLEPDVLRQAQHERKRTPVTLSQSKGDQEARRGGTILRSRVVLVFVGVLLLGGLVTLWSVFPSSFRIPYSTLRTQEAQPPMLPLPDKPSIVVLPFVNMSGDPEQEYFSDGLTEDLISALSRLSALFVISRNSAFFYKGKAVKLSELSKELGVQYVLEGSVRKADGRVRITAQLIDATQDRHLWSERYERPLTDIFALQDEIVQKIVTTLKLQLTLREQGVLVRKTTDNLAAYDYYLQGREYRNRYTKEANVQARQLFERAVALDPAYAEAYAELGWTYYLEWSFKWSQDPQALEQALALAQQALALDDSLPRAHSLLSFVYVRKNQYAQAIAEGERAIALDPNLADSYALQAGVLLFASRSEDALRAIEQGMRLNPHYPAWYLQQLGNAYQQTGRYAEALATHKQLLVRNPNFLWAYPNLAGNYLAQWISQLSPDPQTLGLALETAQRAVALNDSLPQAHMALGSVYVGQKQYEQAIAEIERAIALDPNVANGHALLAEALSRVGRSDEALRAAEQALRCKPLSVDNHLSSVGAAYYLVGRPEEAIAPLKQFLTRYPNILGAHLTLAAAYSELGKEAEARAEAAEVLRLNPRFSLEVHKQRAPIKDPATLERHIAALRKAGLQ